MNNKILWKLDTVCDKLQLVVMHQRVPLSRDFTDHPQARGDGHGRTRTENGTGSLEKISRPFTS